METELIKAARQALDKGYYCVVCGRELPIIDGVIVHGAVPHPPEMDFADEENPQ